jgi:epoxide hydrolase-like predicted phosphatase
MTIKEPLLRAMHMEDRRAMPIRAVIFDIGGVLLTRLEDPMEKWDAFLGLPKGGISMTFAQSGLSHADTDHLSEEEVWTRIQQVLGLDDEHLETFIFDLFSGYERNQEMIQFLKDLRPRYKTATLGNQWPRAREHFNSRYGLAEAIMVETMVYSGEVGMHKPQAGIYQLACRHLGVRPEEALFLDDREDWVEGARQLGMHGIVFRETAQALADVRACLDTHSPQP